MVDGSSGYCRIPADLRPAHACADGGHRDGLNSSAESAECIPARAIACSCDECLASTENVDGKTPLLVEERLRVALRSLAGMRLMASLALEPTGVALLSDLPDFARFTRQFGRALERHLLAIERALPVTAMNLRAPEAKEKS